MAEVIECDFGKGPRESARALAKLLNLIEAQDADLLANPKKYFDWAASEICTLRQGIRAAASALNIRLNWETDEPMTPSRETVVLTKDEYDRLKHCELLVRRLEKQIAP